MWMLSNPNDDSSTVVQVMAWCWQTPSHYPSQCWPGQCRHMVLLGHNDLALKVPVFPVKKKSGHNFDTLETWQNSRQFAADIFKCTILNHIFCICNKISQKFVPNGPTENKQHSNCLWFVHKRPQTCDKLSKPVTTKISDRIWCTWPYWVNSGWWYR